jgi:FKBP-type peptidyl-prolyl cis-trans isomerase
MIDMKYVYVVILFFLISCSVEGVKKNKDERAKLKEIKSDLKQTFSSNKTLIPTKIQDEKKFLNGLKIKWFKHGSGDYVKNEDVIQINYQVFLEDGTLVDGNELLAKSSLPFLVGFGLQTKGWDLALTSLRVGDFVEIFLPSKLARGKKGIKGLIPPNSINIIRLKILEKRKPTKIIDGIKVWLLEENKEESKYANQNNEVEFHYMVGTPSNPKYDISYRRNTPYKLRFNDKGIISGLKKALLNTKRSDKLWLVVPSNEAYGSKGFLDLVKPNEKVFYDIFILEVF